MSEPTPGPWAWRSFGGEWMLMADYGPRSVILCAYMESGYGWDAPGRVYLATNDAAEKRLAEVTPNHPDMRLIAAAPELLAACELWEKGFAEGEQLTQEQFLARVNPIQKAAREAVAKAKGESRAD